MFYPNLLWVMNGTRRRRQSVRSLSRLTRHGVRVRHDRSVGIDPAAGTVELAEGGRLGYDRLVLGLGPQTNPGAIAGAEAAQHG